MEHHAFHVPYLLDTTPEAAFHGQAVKTVVYLRVSTTQQVLGPEARTPEGLAGRLTARWQGGRNPALPRTGRFQDRHRQVWTCPVPPSTAHEHPRAQAELLACISTRILLVPSDLLYPVLAYLPVVIPQQCCDSPIAITPVLRPQFHHRSGQLAGIDARSARNLYECSMLA